jgi:hypothetical protein
MDLSLFYAIATYTAAMRFALDGMAVARWRGVVSLIGQWLHPVRLVVCFFGFSSLFLVLFKKSGPVLQTILHRLIDAITSY